jgi:DNA-binding transcriptional MerR regulator
VPSAETDYITETGQEVESLGQLVKANNLLRIEKRNRILTLRRQGFTPDQISEHLAKGDDDKPPFDITPSGVSSAINRYVRDLTEEDRETVDALRLIDNERLEAMFRRLELDARSTDSDVKVKAVRAQLRILERHAKLNGLDAPVQHQIKGNVDHHLIADRRAVAQVDESFRRRHGGKVIELPAGDVSEEPGE